MARARMLQFGLLSWLALGGVAQCAEQSDSALRAEALRTLRKAAEFYRGRPAAHGGYVYYYSDDLTQRWGEGKTSADTIFVQPPGTPAVGMAYLQAFAATRDKLYIDAARETAEALVYGQLESGGWTQVIDFTPAKRMGKYRNGKGGGWNASSLDDGQTQAALQMLLRADEALGFQHAAIHEAAGYGLTALLKAQFANGAFPQIWTGPVAPQPDGLPARFPDYDWKTVGRVKNYWDYYTINDNLAGSVADVLIEAQRVYRDVRYRAALEKLGRFLILAQMPDPQPGWCQQYNYQMIPIWARKFEPPAVSGWESQDALETLIKIARVTGDTRYLAPVPRGLAWLRKSLLPDGRIARYYEFGTNKPLYMDARYQLTYSDAEAPNHYGWKQSVRLEQIEKAYEAARSGQPAPPSVAADLTAEVRQIVGALDEQGRWISVYEGERLVGQPKFAAGFKYLSSAVFCRNMETLSQWLRSLD